MNILAVSTVISGTFPVACERPFSPENVPKKIELRNLALESRMRFQFSISSYSQEIASEGARQVSSVTIEICSYSALAWHFCLSTPQGTTIGHRIVS